MAQRHAVDQMPNVRSLEPGGLCQAKFSAVATN